MTVLRLIGTRAFTSLGSWVSRGTLGLGLTVLLATPLVHAEEKVTYLHLDAAGSPVAATDEAGNLTWREDYYPYGGRIRNETAAESNTRWFTGHPHDGDTGLTYAGARYYDPVVGRFMAVDPKDFDERNIHSLNRYAYGNNNPYAYVDPDGQVALPIFVPAVVVFVLEAANLALEAHDIQTNPCSDCVRASGASVPGGLGGAAARVMGRSLARTGASVSSKLAPEVGRFSSKDVALGVHEHLPGFKGAAQLGTDFPVDPSKGLVNSILEGIDRAVASGSHIRFNLTGVDVRGALTRGSTVYDKITSQELRHVLRHHRSGTTFYRDGRVVDPSEFLPAGF